jgi:osmoprotectant transport system permease protein
MYRALENGDVDVISAFSSDGRLAGGALRALADPKGAAPSYDAVLLISPERAADRRLRGPWRPCGRDSGGAHAGGEQLGGRPG